MNTKKKGFAGEEEATQYLLRAGYKILERNYRNSRGEIDIVAQVKDKVVFVEVKNWDYYEAESLEFSISKLKQQKLINTARSFLAEFPDFRKNRMRFDVILFQNGLSKIHHIEEAFGEDT